MRSLLIANRGEIAVRIVRACRELGIRAIAVYADQDADAMHVRLADEAFALEGTRPAQTYLSPAALLEVCRRSGAEGVHPGYGFLSENADLAELVIDAGLTWVGPPPAAIRQLGDKVLARQLAARVGAPVIPATEGPVTTAAGVRDFAEIWGYPVIIKARGGGGGRGLKVVEDVDEIDELFELAVSEAGAGFAGSECFVERYWTRARHVEVQILTDSHGNVSTFGTRDCTLQRRNQKLVEEAPAPFLPRAVEATMLRVSRDLARAVGYVGAGTVEFLLSPAGELAFLEVNTRLQVEHSVTEEATGYDLVAGQLRVACGVEIPEVEVEPTDHAIEFRINAEDPARGFLPSPGVLTRWRPPAGPGVRVDAGVAEDDTVPGEFDSLLAKVVVRGPSRDAALARARSALGEFEIEGLPTVLPFHRLVLTAPEFVARDHELRVHTRWIEEEFAARLDPQMLPEELDPPRDLVRSWIELDGVRHRLALPSSLLGLGGGARREGAGEATAHGATDDSIVPAPIPGVLVRWKVGDGQQVAAGETIAVIEAMKMETTVESPRAGIVHPVVDQGTVVAAGIPLARIVAADDKGRRRIV